jgi:hypothetical protein
MKRDGEDSMTREWSVAKGDGGRWEQKGNE